MVKSAYIHIPFCKSRCFYCTFISSTELSLKAKYLEALEKEIHFYYKGEILNTLYFGGGTPSILNIEEINNIIKIFNKDENTEITIELNPDDANYNYLKGLYDIGINRISFGCQTFDEKLLKQINRRHNSQQVISAVNISKTVGFKNVSLDLIYGLPNQTEKMFLKDLKKAIELGVEHISLYGLTIEEGSYFYEKNIKTDDDEQADIYLCAVDFLTKNGYEHYEFSNFSKLGYNSKHNLNYWDNNEYYGFGVGAHGYVKNVRYANNNSIKDYIQNPKEHLEEKNITPKEKLEEEIFLGFRKMKGINVQKINKEYNIDFEKKYDDILNKYEKNKLLKKTTEGYKLTPQGVLLSNLILSEFLEG